MAARQGNVFIEYLVLALIVAVATVAFYKGHLQHEGQGARGQVEGAFSSLCQQLAGAACQ